MVKGEGPLLLTILVLLLLNPYSCSRNCRKCGPIPREHIYEEASDPYYENTPGAKRKSVIFCAHRRCCSRDNGLTGRQEISQRIFHTILATL